MLQNSSFYIILGQDANDLMQLKALLRLSEDQVRYVLTARPGAGLIRFDNTIIPFADDFPKNTICYEMWNTDPDKQNEKSSELSSLQDEARNVQRKRRLSNRMTEREQKEVKQVHSVEDERTTNVKEEVSIETKSIQTQDIENRIVPEKKEEINNASESTEDDSFYINLEDY